MLYVKRDNPLQSSEHTVLMELMEKISETRIKYLELEKQDVLENRRIPSFGEVMLRQASGYSAPKRPCVSTLKATVLPK